MKNLIRLSFSMALFISMLACKTDSKSDTVAQNDDVVAESSDLAIPDLYKGMADSDANELGGLMVGSTAPSFETVLADGNSFNLSTAIKNGPVALVFYRGYWCGYCTKHLAALQDARQELNDKNLSIVAVSPESYKFIAKTIDKAKVDFPIISDNDLQIMKDYQVAYEVSEDYAKKLEDYTGETLAATQNAEQAFLPVPATFIIGKDGKILFAHYEHDYSQRASVEDMLEAIEAS